jgi:uncharacterized delta-60 repeat protein
LDESFGRGGGVRVPLSGVLATNVVATPTGRILVAGYSTDPQASRTVIACLRSNGDLETSYGSGGFVTLPTLQYDRPGSLALSPDGASLLAGAFREHAMGTVIRIDANGREVSIFEVGPPDLPGGRGRYANLELDKTVVGLDGSVLAVGRASKVDGTSDLALTRFLSNGAPDLDFGHQGTVTTALGKQRLLVSAAFLAIDGSAIVIGTLDGGKSSLAAALRYHRTGELNGQFGQGGIAVTAYGSGSGSGLAGCNCAADAVIVAGSGTRKAIAPAYAVLDSLGVENSVTDQRVSTSQAAEGHLAAAGTDAYGRIFLAGRVEDARGSGIGVVRLIRGGQIDRQFGVNGWLTIPLTGDGGAAVSLTFDSENRVVLAANDGTANGLTVLRLLNPAPSAATSLVRFKSSDELRADQQVLMTKIEHDHQMAITLNRSITL